jgi:UDP-glucose 4-epimerase
MYPSVANVRPAYLPTLHKANMTIEIAPEPACILLTGGAGYIGSHTYVALSEAGFKPVILDNFSNSHVAVLDRLAQLTGEEVLCERGDVLDTEFVTAVLERHQCAAVIHLAALKAVGESVVKPLRYYRSNVGGMLSLLEAMQTTDCRTLVLSSSATVYGAPVDVPVHEQAPCAPQNPYAHTKLMCETVLQSLCASQTQWRTGVLRYFNPVGAHDSGLIGEDPRGVPNNLMPFVTQVAVGKRCAVQVFGNDYDTRDGTGVRDYLHVCDLAEGHVAALQALLATEVFNFTVNLGTGRGTSVLGLLQAFERASGQPIPFEISRRRTGDVAASFANVAKAQALLGWRATRDIDDMCRDAWRWQQKNPDGYEQAPSRAGMSAMAA